MFMKILKNVHLDVHINVNMNVPIKIHLIVHMNVPLIVCEVHRIVHIDAL